MPTVQPTSTDRKRKMIWKLLDNLFLQPSDTRPLVIHILSVGTQGERLDYDVLSKTINR